MIRPKIGPINIVIALMLILISTGYAADRVEYSHTNAMGSVIASTDENGNVLWRESYMPFGRRLQQEVTTENNTPFYTGKPHDDATGLSYFGARYYDPNIGRFLGVDPAGIDPNNLHSFNRYAYANNNPYKYVDPDGESPRDVEIYRQSFDQTLKQMVKNGNRLSGSGAVKAHLNNMLGKYICSEQSAEVLSNFTIKVNSTDDKWTFKFQDNFEEKEGLPIVEQLIPGHIWLTGTSSNPQDPVLKIDSHKGTFETLGDPDRSSVHDGVSASNLADAGKKDDN